MGMIYKRRFKRKDGSIGETKTWHLKYYKDGKPYREATKFTKKTDAERLLKNREGDISRGRLPGVCFDKLRFEDLVEDFLTDIENRGRKDQDHPKRTVEKHLAPFFGGMRAVDITSAKVEEYRKHKRRQGYAPATINRHLSALRRMFTIAEKFEKVAQKPHISTPVEKNARKGFLEYDQFLAVRAKLPDYLKGLTTFAYKSTWRKGEVTGLTWSQVDPKQGIVTLEVGMTKNDEPRTFYMDDELQEIFKTQFRNQVLGCPYVFHRKGKRVLSFGKAWAKACKEAGVTGRIFHDLRRSGTRNLVRAGVSQAVAMKVGGWKTDSVFRRYDITSQTDLKEATKRLEVYLESQRQIPVGTLAGTVQGK